LLNEKKIRYKLELLFEHLVKYTFYNIKNSLVQNSVSLKTFSWFCFHFEIYPDLVHHHDVVMIYRSIVKDKKPIDSNPVGLDMVDF